MEEGQSRERKIEFPVSDIVEEVCHTFQAPVKVQEKSLLCTITPMLSIAAAAVESHRGKIITETKDEKSLRITVILPA